MKRYLVAAALAAGTSFASESVRQGDDWVRIFDSPCVSVETMIRIPPEMRKEFRKAQAMFQGQRYFGCYTVRDGVVFLIYDDGDIGRIPADAFKLDPEA